MGSKIDLDRGVVIKRHKATGMYIHMYVDKPGHYIDAFERPVPEALAEEAGFDIKLLGRERLKRERMAKAMSEIEMELALADSTKEEIVLAARNGFKLLELPLGNARVVDENGVSMNPTPIPLETAKRLFEHLAPEEAPEADKKGGK